MLQFGININDVAALASVEAVQAALSDRTALHHSIATAVEDKVKNHLQTNYVPKNKRGDFWKRVHDSVEVRADESSATVSLVELGIGLRYYGGDVFPGKNPAASGPNKGKPTKALAVPSDDVPIANGRQLPPSKMGLLAFLRGVAGGETVGHLVEGMEQTITRGRNKGKTRVVAKPGGAYLYTLRSVTHHAPDPNILPSDADILAAGTGAAAGYVDSFDG